jgi:hypothetical protein
MSDDLHAFRLSFVIVMMPNEEAWRGRDGLDKGFDGFLSQMSFKDGAAWRDSVK